MITCNTSEIPVVVAFVASLALVATLLAPQCQCCNNIDNKSRPSNQNEPGTQLWPRRYKSQLQPKSALREGLRRRRVGPDLTDTVRPDELTKVRPCTSGFSCEFQQQCGLAPLNPSSSAGRNQSHGYITVGKNATYGEWPSFVRVEIEHRYFSLMCGGVLITDRHVLTAAHCIMVHKWTHLEGVTVVLGDHRKGKEDKFERRYWVSSKCSAKKLELLEDETKYDFIILTLEEKVEFNNYVQPACLPFKPFNLNNKTECVVVGMGKTLTKFPEVLQKLPLRQVSCRVHGLRDDDRSRQCWAGNNNGEGDSCNGDSGGPVLCLSPEKRWTVMGLVSYGSKHCDGREPLGWVAVYTRVQALLGYMNADCGV